MATVVNEVVASQTIVCSPDKRDSHYGLTTPWEHYYRPMDTSPAARVQCDLDRMVVFGTIPKEISGTWYRIIPDPHFNPAEGMPFVDGDGTVSAFRIQDGEISMKIKYVETERWLLERKAGQRLFGRYRNPFDNHPCVRLANDSTGNTNIIYWGGKLLALAERGLPWALDPDTLKTFGADPYGGQTIAKTFTAHPKVDVHRNELVTWSYAAKGLSTPDICTYAVDPEGKVSNEFWYQQDKPGWPHDGWVTENWIILSNMPFTINSDEVMKAGGDYWQFLPEQPGELLVMPRKGDAPSLAGWAPGEMRKYTVDPGLIIHTGNAWEEEDGVLKLESHFVSFNIFHFWNPKDYNGPKGEPTGDWKRFTLDLNQPDGTALAPPETLLAGIFDFPTFDERFLGRKSKIIYLGQMMDPLSARPRFNGIVKYNTETGKRDIFYAGKDGEVAEPGYIPRGPDCEEGDGWLVFYLDRESSHKGELVLLDTRDLTKPIAIAQMPFKTRPQVHGNWVQNPHPESPLPLLTGPARDVKMTTQYSQLHRLT